MDYQEILKKLYELTVKKNMRLELGPIREAHKAMGSPAFSFPSIHIAGTNGKGSTACKIAECFALEGFQVGLYTSPHIETFRERIQINGRLISKKEAQEKLLELLSLIDRGRLPPLSFFEITTLLSFMHFKERKVDLAVIETGLGGRLDATNIIHPILSVITSIGLDHTKYLGATLDAIAGEKAGIIKEGVPVILGPNASYPSILQRANRQQAPIIFLPRKNYESFEEENRETARACLSWLSKSYSLAKEKIDEAVLFTPNCRFEIHQASQANIVLDAAHNPPAFFELIKALKARFYQPSFRFIVGFSHDKNVSECLEAIIPCAKHIHLVEAKNPRAAKAEELSRVLLAKQFKENSVDINISVAVEKALSIVDEENEVIVITGSFYIMAEAKQALNLAPALEELTFKSS